MPEAVPAVGVTIWAVLGAAFAAVAVWLAVRIFNRREKWAKCAAIGMAAAPVLYFLSSGPMSMAAFRRQVAHTRTILPDGTPGIQAISHTDLGTWFPIVYAPLVWASDRSWGDFVFSYWELFPNRRTDEEP